MPLESAKHLKGAEKVRAEVLSWIKNNNPLPGARFFSQRELAELLKVDPMTAHKALQQLNREKILYRIQGRGTFVGPELKETACRNYALISSRMNIGDREANPDNWHIVNKIYSAFMQSLLDNETFSTVIVHPKDNSNSIGIRLKGYDAVFFGGESEFSKLISNLIESQKTQVVIIGSRTDSDLKCLHLSCALHESVYKGISYIASAGYRKIAYIGSSKMTEKFDGYKKALSDYGLMFDMNNVVLGIESQCDGARGASLLLGKNSSFDSIFVDTDIKAVGVIDYLASQEIKVPDDIGVMGFDGLEQFINAPPYLTSVKTDFKELIESGLNALRKKRQKGYIEDRLDIPGSLIPNKTLKRKTQ
ncbi:MAG: hypothetical protein A2020_07145 [Lentisphaerae bacterium GWF2_45_14]|nr:MAG: hypothetical protein A2020_07145 [Lentisphaerae bacterium GWF2_45_14]